MNNVAVICTWKMNNFNSILIQTIITEYFYYYINIIDYHKVGNVFYFSILGVFGACKHVSQVEKY